MSKSTSLSTAREDSFVGFEKSPDYDPHKPKIKVMPAVSITGNEQSQKVEERGFWHNIAKFLGLSSDE